MTATLPGERDERARARRAAPDGPTQTITGTRRVEHAWTMSSGRVQRAARRVELDDDRGAPSSLALRDAVAQVAGHDLVDDAGGGQHVDARLAVVGRGCVPASSSARHRPRRQARPASAARDRQPDGRSSCLRVIIAPGCQEIEQQRAPGLEPVAPRRRPRRWSRTAPSSLSRLADGHRPTSGLGRVDQAQVDCADRVASSLSRPSGSNSGTKSASSSSRHSRQAAQHVRVTRVDVAADADRVALVQPRVAAGLRAAHEEDALAVAQHEVRDDLLPGWDRPRPRRAAGTCRCVAHRRETGRERPRATPRQSSPPGTSARGRPRTSSSGVAMSSDST